MEDIDTESLQKLEQLLANTDPSKMSRKEILDMLDASEMAEEMKENLRAMLTGDAPKLFGVSASGTALGILFVVIIFSIILFFGYKLYKSITDKEKKREEKKKAKQMKKKK
ncbi:uncharacterized protein [Epargyreus clarus]|uniref:uncharacterized protein isoform X2 n=1 Tax=Epargyreus clarus TaxID=520877 RepID=UPI003C2B658C